MPNYTANANLPEPLGTEAVSRANYIALIEAIDAAFGTKLAVSSYTAEDILAKLLGVDGSGSELNADMTDNLHLRLADNYGLEFSSDGSTYHDSFRGAFGARTTGGVTDWNDITNITPGSGHTLLMSTAFNGPSSAGALSGYYHAFNFEYSTKTGAGNITQLAVPYTIGIVGATVYIRSRYNGVWTVWQKLWSDNELRITNGTLEFNNGGVWTPVGTRIVKPSANIKHSLVASEKTAVYGTTTNGRLLAKVVPKFSGTMRILATVKGVSASCYIATASRDTLDRQTPARTMFDFDLPIDTLLGNTPAVETPISIGAGTVYTVVQRDVVVKEGEALFFVLYAAASGGTAYVNSLSIAYDEITATYIA